MQRSLTHLTHFVLLIIFTVQCGAIDYYVKPAHSDTATVTCPLNRTCLTINQYTDPSNNYLQQNNTIFTFLPGKHVVERPIEFNNVKNITLQSIINNDGDYPQLIPRNYVTCIGEKTMVPYVYPDNRCNNLPTPCCCSNIQLKEVLNITISGLMIEAGVNISGIIIGNSINIHIEHIIIISSNVIVNDSYGVGISIVNGSSEITIESLNTSNVLFGVLIWGGNDVMVYNSSFHNSYYSGLYMIETNHSKLQNLVSNHSGGYGISLLHTRYSLLENINVTWSSEDGLLLYNCTHTTAFNLEISSQNNYYSAVNIWYSSNMTINVLSMNTQRYGITIWYSNNTTVTNISLVNTTVTNIVSVDDDQKSFLVLYSTSTILTNIFLLNSHPIVIASSNDTILRNVVSIGSHNHGIVMGSSYNTTMTNISLINNKGSSVSISECNNTKMMNIKSMTSILTDNYEENGIEVLSSTSTTLTNISSINRHGTGILIYQSIDTVMSNVMSIENDDDGIRVASSDNTTMINISSINNKDLNYYIENAKNTEMINVQTSMKVITGRAVATSSISLRFCSNLRIQNISLLANKIIHNNAMYLYVCTDILLEDSVFSGLMSDLQQVTTNVPDLPAIIAVQKTTMTFKNCKFTNNTITSISVTSSNITLDENILFENNSAISGTAFIFSRSVLIVTKHSNVVFRNNFASQYGAAIYIVTNELHETSILLSSLVNPHISYFYTAGTQCFIQVNATRSNTAHLTFTNNTAMKGGDVVYGGLVAAGYDGDWNCLLSFKNISDMTGQSSARQITSEPSRVCLCHDTSPDCLIVADSTMHTIYPGETLPVSVAVVGQDFGTVSGYVYAHMIDTVSSNSIVLDEQTIVSYDNGACSNLNYAVYSSCEDCKAVLVLTSDGGRVSKLMNVTDNQRLNQSWSILQSQSDYHALAFDYAQKLINITTFYLSLSQDYDTIVDSVIDDFFVLTPETNFKNGENICYNYLKSIPNKLRFPTQIYTYPLYLNIQFLPCPLGFTLSPSDKCDCILLLKYMPTVWCDIDGQIITRAGSVWVGVDDNQTIATSQYCPLNYCKNDSIQLTLNDNASTNSLDSQCNYKHSGILCGSCQPGLSLALGSEQCLHCSNAYISLILPFFLAGILLVLFIKVLDFTVCHGAINGLIFYANIISANKHLYYNQSDINPITLFISWFNLDFGIETCFYDGLTAYGRTWLQFIFPIYIWCIAGGIIFLANHSKRMAMISGNNGVPVLSTLFLLSYAKLFNTIISVISYTTLYTTQGQRLVWTVDGNIDYLGPKHAPLFAVAVFVLLFLWLPYTLILLLGKYLNKINCRLITRYLLKLKPFLDANYAPFNDRHQYWFGVILVIKAVILLSSATIPANGAHIIVFSIVIASCLLTFWGNMVFPDTKTMLLHTFFFVNLVILNATKLFIFNKKTDMMIASYVLIGLVLIQFVGVLLVKIIKLHSSMICCKKNEIIEEEDWDLYLDTVAQRENSDTESDNESFGQASTIESLQTYPLLG